MDTSSRYIGRILDNRYEILELIGVGGMAYVYKALCHRLNRLVAIKILKEEFAADEDFQRRFYTESQAVAMLSHPNIVAVYDVSRSGNAEYIVMELIEGITLKQYINRKGLLNWKETLHFTTQIVKALVHAHSRGIIHRDIKPHNIMILKDGSVKVADFGIARLLSMQNTLTQEALGSVHYISPEQAKGGNIDARSDIYSVGVVMYEMLTSRLPFVGDTAVSVAIQHISAIPLRPSEINPDIPRGLEEITMHAMEPDVHIRFTTAEEMLLDLEEFRKHPGIVFNYSLSNPAERVSADAVMPYETRVIPREAIPSGDNRLNRGIVGISPRPKSDLTTDEYRDAKRRKNNTATLIGIFGVVLFVIAITVFFIFPMLRDTMGTSDEDVTILDFVGLRFTDFENDVDLREIYQFFVEYANNEDVPEGIVFRQEPSAGDNRPAPVGIRRINVRLWVSTGDELPVEMPNLIGLHRTDARNQINNLRMDLQVIFDTVETEDEDLNNLVVETRPREGELLSRGNEVLIRYYTTIAERVVRVPENLVGITEIAALRAFEGLDLEPHVLEFYHPTVPVGVVYFVQFEGTSVPADSIIEIHVSLGPEPTPTPSPSPDPDPTPSPTPTLPPTSDPDNGSGDGDSNGDGDGTP
ncbi:MAG: Stk1 family PASTA domain-containing Ser/Thr kinase [Oscillospiraceae bacterium]|jgi:serine/threonine-protein kinase|nr:Stk1 family PASTA domain-containing Ser/Thr kinase [Oscillospiraceae bacterium]